MRVLLIANANSVHTQKWAIGLSKRGVQIYLFTLSVVHHTLFEEYDIELFSFGMSDSFVQYDGFGLSKIRYLKIIPILKQKIEEFNPDILHAHYASGYGAIGALTHFSPFIISVWGSDIYDFPKKSFFHKKLIEFNLKKATKILSTSHVMVKEIEKYTTKKIEVTPFGVDIHLFRPMEVKSLFNEGDIVIGTIKTLEREYGIEYLIKAFKILTDKHTNLPLKLLIVGGGSLENKLKALTKKLKIDNQTLFTGKIPSLKTPNYHNMLSIALFPSNSESFGVAVIEASSSARPVVVSSVGGLLEVVERDITGLIVPPQDAKRLAEATERLILDKELRKKMGQAGRKRVKRLYNWEENVNQMMDIYKDIVQ